MCWRPQTSGYSYPRVTAIRINVHPAGEARPTCHAHLTLSLCMVPNHTYLTRSAHSNLSWVTDRFGWIPLLSRKRNSRLHPQHVGWPICGSPSSFSPTLNQKNSRLKSGFYRWQATRLTGSIYKYAIGTFNTCLRGSTHRSLTDTGGAYNLGGAGFPHLTPQPS
jgi:hypothetical protein